MLKVLNNDQKNGGNFCNVCELIKVVQKNFNFVWNEEQKPTQELSDYFNLFNKLHNSWITRKGKKVFKKLLYTVNFSEVCTFDLQNRLEHDLVYNKTIKKTISSST